MDRLEIADYLLQSGDELDAYLTAHPTFAKEGLPDFTSSFEITFYDDKALVISPIGELAPSSVLRCDAIAKKGDNTRDIEYSVVKRETAPGY